MPYLHPEEVEVNHNNSYRQSLSTVFGGTIFAPTDDFFRFATSIKRDSLPAATLMLFCLDRRVSFAPTKFKTSICTRFHLLLPKSEIKFLPALVCSDFRGVSVFFGASDVFKYVKVLLCEIAGFFQVIFELGC